jgi:hypothetical protein
VLFSLYANISVICTSSKIGDFVNSKRGDRHEGDPKITSIVIAVLFGTFLSAAALAAEECLIGAQDKGDITFVDLSQPGATGSTRSNIYRVILQKEDKAIIEVRAAGVAVLGPQTLIKGGVTVTDVLVLSGQTMVANDVINTHTICIDLVK